MRDEKDLHPHYTKLQLIQTNSHGEKSFINTCQNVFPFKYSLKDTPLFKSFFGYFILIKANIIFVMERYIF